MEREWREAGARRLLAGAYMGFMLGFHVTQICCRNALL